MFFKKKKLPALKEHLIKKGSEIIDNSDNELAVYYTKFIFIILNDKLFGQTRKEKIKLDNDVSVFELLCYSFSRLYLYFSFNHPNREVLPLHKAMELERQGLESGPKHDIINVFEKVTESLLKDYLNWENTFDKMQNRINFYLQNESNLQYRHQIFESAINNSLTIKEPTYDIVENWDLRKSDLGKSFFFSANIIEFEKAYMPLVFKETEIFLETDKNVGFTKRKTNLKE